MKRSAAALVAFVLAACADTPMNPAPDAAFTAAAIPNGFGPAGSAVYEVEITNLTSGQAFTPALLAAHRRPTGMFTVGNAASFELKEIAENGNLTPMADALNGNTHVAQVAIGFGAGGGPILPGETITVQISTERAAKYLSWASMLICTNDGFTGLDGIRLPDKVDESISFDTNGYDAGTEINTEDFADLVPPCPVLSGVPSTDPGTGTSDPALAESGVIRHHPGIQGGTDLTPGIHGWTDPVAHVTVTRIS